MDKLAYIAMSGAAEAMKAQAVHANNIANSTTAGFRAELQAQRSLPVYNSGLPTRVYAATHEPGYDFTPGTVVSTGKPLQASIKGEGFFAVQSDLGEGYNRRGDFSLTSEGFMIDGGGNLVLGEGGPLIIPPADSIEIGTDGMVAIKPLGSAAGTLVDVGRLKLVNPEVNTLQKDSDGLFRSKDGAALPVDEFVTVNPGSYESSNVSVVTEMVELIALSRKFELDVKLMDQADDNSQNQARLLQIG
jgi:flagellar basal-body rod protein FlgF